jgi:hypothetical protein
VGDVFRFVVKLFQRVHRSVDRAAEWQRWIVAVSVAAQFFWATKQGLVEAEKDGEEEDKVTKKQRKKWRQQAGLRLKAKWRQVAKAVVQGAQPTERARIVVLARQRRAELGQLLLQAADRGAEGVRLRRVLARALYSWGLGHAQDRARCIQVKVRGDTMVQCRKSFVMGSAIGQWHRNRVYDRAWVQVGSRYGWYCMHETLVQGLSSIYYDRLMVQWKLHLSILARSREHMFARSRVVYWWAATCLNSSWLNRKWAHLCEPMLAHAGEAMRAWAQKQEHERGREQDQAQEQELRQGEGCEATGQGRQAEAHVNIRNIETLFIYQFKCRLG